MSVPAALFARTFVIGIAVAAPVGAIGVLCIQRTLSRGWRAGIATGLGVATADMLYAGMAAFGVSALASVLVAAQVPLRLVGGAVLMWLGYKAMHAPPPSGEREQSPERSSSKALAMYGSSVGLTLTNPMTIMAFGAIFAGAGLAAQPGPLTAAIATAGVGTGSLAWWLVLVTAVSVTGSRLQESLLAGLNRVSGIVIGGFGVIALAGAVLSLLGG